MIALIQAEVCERKKWISNEEILDIIAIAESTPGPISINSATYIGYKVSGILGSILATLGVALPSFIIIFIISLFIEPFLANTIVAKAFLGIKCAVFVLIFFAAIKLSKNIKYNWLSIIIICLVMSLTLLFEIIDFNFSSIYFILIGGFIGVIYTLTQGKKEDTK